MEAFKLAMPCEIPCSKCGSKDVYRQFRRQNEWWHKCIGDFRSWEDEFVKSDYGTLSAKRDCIIHHCRICQYDWATEPLNDLAPSSCISPSPVVSDELFCCLGCSQNMPAEYFPDNALMPGYCGDCNNRYAASMPPPKKSE